jgi:hypothetical protein
MLDREEINEETNRRKRECQYPGSLPTISKTEGYYRQLDENDRRPHIEMLQYRHDPKGNAYCDDGAFIKDDVSSNAE